MQIDCSIFLGSSGSNWLQTMDQYSNPGFWTITGKSPFKAPQAASLPWDNINSSHRDSSLVLLLNKSHGVSPTPHAYRNSILVNPWEGQRLENTASVGAHSTILLGNTTREVTGPYRSAIEKLKVHQMNSFLVTKDATRVGNGNTLNKEGEYEVGGPSVLLLAATQNLSRITDDGHSEDGTTVHLISPFLNGFGSLTVLQ